MSGAGGEDRTAAALLELARLRAELSKVDGRVTSNWVRLSPRVAQLAAQLDAMGKLAASHGEAVAAIAAEVAALRQQLAGPGSGADGDEDEGYEPVPAPRWWLLEGEDRDEAVARLAGWVGTVYVPGYGTLASRLPKCWAEHPLCLYALDWLSEMHGVLYLQPERSASMLGAQAEWQTRLLPAAVDQMAAECRSCQHATAALNGARR